MHPMSFPSRQLRLGGPQQEVHLVGPDEGVVSGQRLGATAVGNPLAGLKYLGGTRRETADHHLIAIGEPGEPVAPAIGTGVKTYMKR
jgi:hypothetical protein